MRDADANVIHQRAVCRSLAPVVRRPFHKSSNKKVPHMKLIKVLLFTLFISVCASAQEQLAKGVISVGGSLSYMTAKMNYTSGRFEGLYTKTRQTSLTPSFAIFVLNRLQIGASWGYMFYKSTLYNADGSGGSSALSKQRNYGFNGRYYYPLDDHALFVGAGYVYFVSLDDYVGRSFTGEIGMNLFFSKSVAVEPSIQYINSPLQNTSENAMMIAIGFRYFIL
jgi:hypothetical protein